MSDVITYAGSGVNPELGDAYSQVAGQVCAASFKNSPFVHVDDPSGHFRGLRTFNYVGLPDGISYESTSDGTGTKSVITAAANRPRASVWDLGAMVGMDAVRYGGMGLVINNILDVFKLGEVGSSVHDFFLELIYEYGVYLKHMNLVGFRGETAELNTCVGSDLPDAYPRYNWGATLNAVYDPARLILGDDLEAGMIVVALQENGFRANGMSLVRKVLARMFGQRWWENPAAQAVIYAAAEPSVCYELLFQHCNGWMASDFQRLIKIFKIIHVTGGGLEGKFWKDVLVETGLSANLEDLYELPGVMTQVVEAAKLSDAELYATLNGGQGALAILSQTDVADFLMLAKLYKINAKVCGRLEKRSTPTLRIASKFNKGKDVIYA